MRYLLAILLTFLFEIPSHATEQEAPARRCMADNDCPSNMSCHHTQSGEWGTCRARLPDRQIHECESDSECQEGAVCARRTPPDKWVCKAES